MDKGKATIIGQVCKQEDEAVGVGAPDCLGADSLHMVSYSQYYFPIVQIRKLDLGERK